ncbi:MAG: 16S rRNA (cytosine(967)-C(5))-methyltransferase RsmB [Magnetococcales bacterium]|nr:16S rRNA (cytosine(967)-C(5))-methyltransferase RsmB [Magnetococcales bacterium]
MPPDNPRRIAIEAVMRVMRDGLALEADAGRFAQLTGRDRALAMEIAAGTLRYFAIIDGVLRACMPRPLARGRHFLWAVLCTALYQARWMRIPVHAAVHEAVELVKNSPDRPKAGFVNAVLRQAVLVDPTGLWSGLADPAARLALELSYPEWLARRWVARIGEARTRARMEAGNREADLTLRVNTLVADRKVFIDLTKGHPFGRDGVVVDSPGPIDEIAGYREGWFAVQDGAAQWAGRLLGPTAGEDILDLCAAPGGKTTHLAALAGGQARIYAVDRSEWRLRRLRENLERLRVPGVEVVVGDAVADDYLPGMTFDRVLVDAPCTGSGVIRRHPDIKWRRCAEDPARMAATQSRILEAAARRVRPGGVLVYAVCSLEPEEGEEQIAAFLAAHPDWRRQPVTVAEGVPASVITAEKDFFTEPGWEGMDGFFISRLCLR